MHFSLDFFLPFFFLLPGMNLFFWRQWLRVVFPFGNQLSEKNPVLAVSSFVPLPSFFFLLSVRVPPFSPHTTQQSSPFPPTNRRLAPLLFIDDDGLFAVFSFSFSFALLVGVFFFFYARQRHCTNAPSPRGASRQFFFLRGYLSIPPPVPFFLFPKVEP